MEASIHHNTRRRFGVFTAWFKGDYQYEFISGIEYEAKRHDIHILYFAGRVPHSPYPYEEYYNIVYNTALEASLDGLVVMPMHAGFCTNEEFNNFLSQFSLLPLVTINSKTPYGNAIFADNAVGFKTLMRHLIEDHGYRRLAFIGGPDINPDAAERARIYTSMLKSYRIPFNSLLVAEGKYFYQSGIDAVRTFFDDRDLRLGVDIEVIVCATMT